MENEYMVLAYRIVQFVLERHLWSFYSELAVGCFWDWCWLRKTCMSGQCGPLPTCLLWMIMVIVQ